MIMSNFGFPALMSWFGASASNNGPSILPVTSSRIHAAMGKAERRSVLPSQVSSLRLSMQIQLLLSGTLGLSSQLLCSVIVSLSSARRSFARSTDSVFSHPTAVIQSPYVMGTPPDPRSGSVRFVALLSSFSTAMSCPSEKSPVQPSAMYPLTASNTYSEEPNHGSAEKRSVC